MSRCIKGTLRTKRQTVLPDRLATVQRLCSALLFGLLLELDTLFSQILDPGYVCQRWNILSLDPNLLEYKYCCATSEPNMRLLRASCD